MTTQLVRTFLVFDVAAALPLYLIDVNLYMFKILRTIHLPRAYRVFSDRILVIFFKFETPE